MKANQIKIVLGIIIFLFSVALAYFTANYMDRAEGPNYWLTLAIYAGAYVLVGIITAVVLPICLGFLFSADVLLLHILFERYGKVDVAYKVLLVAFILFVLYVFTWLKLGDKPVVPAHQAFPGDNPPLG